MDIKMVSEVDIFDDKGIHLRLKTLIGDTVVDTVHTVCHTHEAQTICALVSLGWTPPDGQPAANKALLEEISRLRTELAALRDSVESGIATLRGGAGY